MQNRCAGRNGVVFPYSAGVHNNRENTHKLLHSSIKTTMIYTQVSNKAIKRISGPLDGLNLTTENKGDKKNIVTLGGQPVMVYLRPSSRQILQILMYL